MIINRLSARSTTSAAWLATAMAGLVAGSAHAVTINDYLVIATGDGENGKVFIMSNSEIGAIGSNPSTSPPGSLPGYDSMLYRGPSTGITRDGDVAITDPDLKEKEGVTFSNSDVHMLNTGPGNEGSQGVDCAIDFDACTDSGSQISSNNEYNTSVPASFNDLDENLGIQGGASFGTLLSDLGTANSDYWSVASTGTWNWLAADTDGDTYVFTLADGLNVIDINTGGNDLYFANTNFVVSGEADDFVIFRVNAGWTFNVSQSNLLLGGTLGTSNILFLVNGDQGENSFNFNNVAFYGYSFWDYGGRSGDNVAHWNNVRGCGQVVTDYVNFQNVSMSGCAFDYVEEEEPPPPPPVPEPGTLALLGLGLLGLGMTRRRAA